MLPHAMVVVGHNASPDKNQEILGVTLSDRFRLTAKKAGLGTFHWLDRETPAPILPETFVAVSSSVLPSLSALKQIASIEPEPESVYTPESGAQIWLIRTTATDRAVQSLRSPSYPASALNSFLKPCTLPVGPGGLHALKDSGTNETEQWLLNALVKDNEGFMSKHLERRISLAVTRRIAHTLVTPNHITAVSTLIGSAGALCFLAGERWLQFTGSLLFWLHSVLDGCDGELSRLKFLESRWGGLIDFWSDNAVHAAVFACIAAGSYRVTSQERFQFLGFSAVAGTLLSAFFVFWKTMRAKNGSGPVFTSVMDNPALTAPSDRVMDFLARRDFIYLVILFSILGKAEWFLWMGAFGAPLYFTVLVLRQAKKV